MEKALTAENLAALLQVDIQIIWRETRLGNIPCFFIGKRVRYDPDVIKAWMQRSKKEEISLLELGARTQQFEEEA